MGRMVLTKLELAAIREDFREYLAWPLLVMILLSVLIWVVHGKTGIIRG
jgi:hypothetical protein